MQSFHVQLQDSLNTSSVSTHQPPAVAPLAHTNYNNSEAAAPAMGNGGPSRINVVTAETVATHPQAQTAGDVTHTTAPWHTHVAGGRRVSEAAATPETTTNAAETGWKEVQRQQIIDHANELLKFCAIKNVVTSIRQCTSSFFVLLYQRLFDCTISGIDRAPNTPEKKLQNVSLVLEELRKRNYDLRNISVEEVVRLNEDHISRLVLVFVQIATAMYTAQQRRLQGHMVTEGSGATAAAPPSRGYTVAEVTPPPPPAVSAAAAQNVYDTHGAEVLPPSHTQAQVTGNAATGYAEGHAVAPHHATAAAAATGLYEGAPAAQPGHVPPYTTAAHLEHAGAHLMGHNNNTTAVTGAVYAMGASPSEYARYHAHHAARHHDAALESSAAVQPATAEETNAHRYYYYYTNTGNEHQAVAGPGERVPQPLSRSPDEGNTEITSGYSDEEGENEYDPGRGSVIPTDVLVKNWYRTIVFPPVSPDSQPRPPQPHPRPTTHPSRHSTATTTTTATTTSASERALAATETSSARPASEANVEASHPRARRASPLRHTTAGAASPAATADHVSAERVTGHRMHGAELATTTPVSAAHTAGRVPGLLSTPQRSPLPRQAKPKPRSSFADEVQELQRRQRSLNEALQRRPHETERQGKRKTITSAAAAAAVSPSRSHPHLNVTPDVRREGRTPPSWAAEHTSLEEAAASKSNVALHHADEERGEGVLPSSSVVPQREDAGRAVRWWHQRAAGPLVEAPLTRVECRLLASHPQRQIDAAVRDRKIERLRAARFLGDAQSRLRQRMRQQYDESMAAMRERLRQSLAIAAQSKHDHMRRMRDENDKYRQAYATLMQAAVNDVRVPTHMMSRHTMNLAEYYAASLEESRRMCRYLEKEQERRNRADLIDYAQSVSAWQQQVLV